MSQKNSGYLVTKMAEHDHVDLLAHVPRTLYKEMSIDQLRKQQSAAHREFQTALDSVVDVLATVSPIKAAVSTFNTIDGAALARASKRVGLGTRDRRDLAKTLLIGALLNHDNPDWDPADASTDRANHDDPFLAMLERDLSGLG